MLSLHQIRLEVWWLHQTVPGGTRYENKKEWWEIRYFVYLIRYEWTGFTKWLQTHFGYFYQTKMKIMSSYYNLNKTSLLPNCCAETSWNVVAKATRYHCWENTCIWTKINRDVWYFITSYCKELDLIFKKITTGQWVPVNMEKNIQGSNWENTWIVR